MKLLKIFLFLVFLWCYSGATAQNVGLPLDHWAYPYLQHLQSRGLLTSRLFVQRPISRQALARALADIEQQRLANSSLLSAAETKILNQLKAEFQQELQTVDATIQGQHGERHIYAFERNGQNLFFDLYAKQQIRSRVNLSDSTRVISRTTAGGIVRGYLHPGLSFYAETHNTLIKGQKFVTEQFNPAIGEPVVLSGANAFSDDAQGYIVYDYKKFSLKIGRDPIVWGNRLDGGLVFHHNHLNYDQVLLRLNGTKLGFSSLHAYLLGEGVQRFIAGNRLDWQMTPATHLSLYETAVYGHRSLQPFGQLPLFLNKLALSQQGLSINRGFGLELDQNFAGSMASHLELFVDQIKKGQDRYAYALETTWTNLPVIPNLELSLNYIYVKRNTFGAINLTQPATTFQHYNGSVGISLSSADLTSKKIAIQYFYQQFLIAGLEINQARFTRFDSLSKPMGSLISPPLQENTIQLKLRWQLAWDFFVSTEVTNISRKFTNHFDKAWQFFFEFSANY